MNTITVGLAKIREILPRHLLRGLLNVDRHRREIFHFWLFFGLALPALFASSTLCLCFCDLIHFPEENGTIFSNRVSKRPNRCFWRHLVAGKEVRNHMANNFFEILILYNSWIATLPYWVADFIHGIKKLKDVAGLEDAQLNYTFVLNKFL